MLRATLTGGSFYIIEILYKIFYCLFFCQNCLFIGKQYCLSSFYRSKRIEALLFRIKHLLWNQAIVLHRLIHNNLHFFFLEFFCPVIWIKYFDYPVFLSGQCHIMPFIQKKPYSQLLN